MTADAAVPLADGEVERRPGRPRSIEVDRAILQAALDEYAERGYEGMSVDAVATRAGVSKATIYRRYPCKTDLVLAAAEAMHDDWEPPNTGDLRADLQTLLRHLRQSMVDTTLGRANRKVVADSLSHPDLAEAFHAFVARRRTCSYDIVRRGLANGEILAGTEPKFFADLVAGPFFYRLYVSGEPLDDAYLDAVVDAALRACAPPAAR